MTRSIVRPARAAAVALLVALAPPCSRAAEPAPALDPEELRRFFESGPALLLPKGERERLAAAPLPERARFAADFLARDPDPSTGANELREAIERRRELVLGERLSLFDERGQLLFLLGPPAGRHRVECGDTYKPLELWSFGAPLADEGPPPPGARVAVLYRPRIGAHHRAWRPTDAKRVLYTPEIEYLMEQFEELRGRITGKRPDLYFCKDARRVDELTGVDGLFGFRRHRLRDAEVEALFAPPDDLAAWSRAALAAPRPEGKSLPLPGVATSFRARDDQRLGAWVRLELPPGVELGVAEEKSGKESRLALHVVLERPEALFQEFDVRFAFPPLPKAAPVFLEFERPLRPKERFVARYDLRDEISGARVAFERALEVPAEPTQDPVDLADAQLGQVIGLAKLGKRDTVLLLPPADDVVFGLWRAEALVSGDRIAKLVFLVDGKPQLARKEPPWTAELRLATTPQETVVRVEALDEEGETIAADEVLLNEPQGEPRVKLLAPPRGQRVAGRARAKAAVVTQAGNPVESVEFRLNDQTVALLGMPPWEATVDVPAGGALAYLTAIATYADGTKVEDLRVLNATEIVEEIQVDLVEVYAVVTDRAGKRVGDLAASDFELLDNGRRQEISKFERVEGLPLTLGLVLDTSGSMEQSIGEAKRAAEEFVAAVVTPKDRTFAIGFSERPRLLLPLTSDARAITISFRDLPAMGATALHDTIVYALYQFRGVRGQKAMVLLSDGDDTASKIGFDDALGYAQRAGVAIYTIGLGVGGASLGIRAKLERLAAETGGRTFFVSKASELTGVYDQIEQELRSRYLLAFTPEPPPREGERHALEVKVGGGKWKARTARGYTP
jgi:Ca-activated chloride channel family protein